ncbi:MAG: hypothetical protein FWE62_06515, partial [Firmicutes bacterium]|nr:hypothetical protein [Bacillota bacterium]
MTSIRADKKQSVKADKSSLMYKRVPLERVVYGVVFALFSLYVVSLVFPFVWIFVNSLKTNLQFQDDIDHQKLFALPVAWLFKNYIYAFSQMKDGNGVTFLSMAVNSVWYMLVSAGIGVFASAMTGYVMSKFRFRGRGVVYSVIIFSMTVPIVGTLGAAFRLWSNIGLYDTPLFPVVSHLGGLGFNFLVMYGFFKNISSSYA